MTNTIIDRIRLFYRVIYQQMFNKIHNFMAIIFFGENVASFISNVLL